ncbi:hypothetical protein DelCs14_2705 [Delftia sp. Cs1-4]|uniref:hypothetical protein n=1 Tax=Delftia sp. (strain Cs1-4) TaxID=742013 RepID=UPI00020E82FD|nr:hypothetical protein [Delftia sp. Cs1-4]AEF89717.1 hypothetical protein DelCs14_2705 [Delftia sp. Cs1-4]
MGNALIKNKKLVEFVPATAADPGFPGRAATPERITYEWRDVRVEAGINEMQRVEYTAPDGSKAVGWRTPLDALSDRVGNPLLSAEAAHYSDIWALADITVDGVIRRQRVPLTWTSAWIMRRENVRIVIPAQPAIPARPPKVATPERRTYDWHFGWNGGAHSLRELPANWIGTASFIVGKAVGAVVGFTLASRVPRDKRSSFDEIENGLVFGDGEISVRHAGATLGSVGAMTGSDTVRAQVGGGRIEWFLNDVSIYKGPFRMSEPEPFVLDAVLYCGDDAVDSPQLDDGLPAEDGKAVLMLARLKAAGQALEPMGMRLALAPLDLFAADRPLAQVKARLRPLRVAGDPIPRGALRLAGAQVRASDARNDAVARPTLARLQATAQVEVGEGAWIPQYSIGTAFVPPPVVNGALISGQGHDYQMRLGPAFTVASQDRHAEGRLTLAPLQLLSDVEALTHLVRAQDLLGADAALTASGYVTLVIAERVGASGALTLGAAGLVLDVHEQISSAAETQISGAIVASVLEHLGAVERYRALVFRVVDGRPVMVDPGHAWVVNTESSASTRYEGYAFDSFMTVGGRQFGVRADGVYSLGGSTDAGLPIEWGAGLGKHDFGSQAIKRLESVHAGVSATGQLYVRIGDGQQTHTYRARRVDAAQRVQRFDPGRGLAANYFTFDLVGEGAAELDNIVFGVVAGQRRIGRG